MLFEVRTKGRKSLLFINLLSVCMEYGRLCDVRVSGMRVYVGL